MLLPESVSVQGEAMVTETEAARITHELFGDGPEPTTDTPVGRRGTVTHTGSGAKKGSRLKVQRSTMRTRSRVYVFCTEDVFTYQICFWFAYGKCSCQNKCDICSRTDNAALGTCG